MTPFLLTIRLNKQNRFGVGVKGRGARIDAMALQHYTTSSGELGTLVLTQRDISSGRTLSLAHVDS